MSRSSRLKSFLLYASFTCFRFCRVLKIILWFLHPVLFAPCKGIQESLGLWIPNTNFEWRFDRGCSDNRNLSNYKLTRKKVSGLQSTGFEPMASALALQLSNQLSCEDPPIHWEQANLLVAALKQRPWVRIPLRSRNFFRVNLQLLKLQLPLRRSFKII